MLRTSSALKTVTGGSVLALTVLSLAGAASTGAAVASRAARPAQVRSGHVEPAVVAGPHFRRVGRPSAADDPFSCQDTSPVTCYGPTQMRHAYGVDKLGRRGLNGKGTTIVIVDAFSAPAIRDDLSLFDQTFGLPDPKLNIIAPQGLTPFDPTDATQVGWSAEISLDVEWAHAIAPKARIDLVLSKSSDDGDIQNALKYVANRHLGTVVSQSYGEAESCSTVSITGEQHRIFRSMVKHGTTVLASAGDEGAAEPTCDNNSWIKSASTPASDPLVTGIGGTTLVSDPSFESESVWNEPDYAAAGGSGFSTYFKEPAFQRSVQGSGRRSVPDVSYHASISTGVLVAWGESEAGPGAFYQFGGTSCGSPQWAGLVALAAQKAQHRLGDINPTIYRLGTSSRYHRLFHDVTSGNTSVVEQDSDGNNVAITGSAAHRGWDAATGFGSPKANRLVPALAR